MAESASEMIDLREIRSVTEFQRNIKDYVGRLKKSKVPLVLTGGRRDQRRNTPHMHLAARAIV